MKTNLVVYVYNDDVFGVFKFGKVYKNENKGFLNFYKINNNYYPSLWFREATPEEINIYNFLNQLNKLIN